MPSILFVCTANQFRSPIAAACLLKQIEQDNTARKWKVESAGTWAKNGLAVPGFTLETAKSLGLRGLENHRARQIAQGSLQRFDLVLVMERGHKEAICAEFPSVCHRVYLLPELVDGLPYDIPDPARRGGNPAEAGSILYDLIARGKTKILELAETLSKK